MIVLKSIGCLLLLISGIGCAGSLNGKAERALRQVEGLMALMRYMKTQIDCFALPISQILSEYDVDALKVCGYWGESIPEDLRQLVEKSHVYDEAALKIMKQFSLEFGKEYRAEQVRACEYALALLGVLSSVMTM